MSEENCHNNSLFPFSNLQSYVPPSSKDEKYWDKRIKNNVAARRSREARRLKENQVSVDTEQEFILIQS